MLLVSVVLYVLLCHDSSIQVGGMLYPRDTESRQVLSLDGIWNFKVSPSKNSVKGYKEKWFSRNLKDTSGSAIPMPVPASYNDITQDKSIRDHVGVVWYDRKFFVPKTWETGTRVWLRFGSVCYAAQVWVNGELVTNHEIGHLPFQQDVTGEVKFGAENLLTVAVDNTLLQTTIPQGTINELTIGNQTIVQQGYSFDFFNYAGIDRSVQLYSTPLLYIDDITVSTSIDNSSNGIVQYSIGYAGQTNPNASVQCNVALSDKTGKVVATANSCTGSLTVANPNLWWPYLMNSNPGYLYSLKAEITEDGGVTTDVYRQAVGIRTLRWTSTSFLINEKPIYIRGFGRHEDSDIRGKGLDLPLIVKDHNLLKWVGANAYRTSHYPYAEEIMDMADQLGIMIIDECPSVDTDIFSSTLLQKHKNSLTELIQRDKNRPSVIIWSVANEPRTQLAAADSYFRDVVAHVKTMDTSRPVTIAIARGYSEDKAAQYLDIIGFNRYNSWYANTGKTETIYDYVISEATNWHNKFNKPIIMTEYGADTVAGLHMDPEFVFSEEYQMVVLGEHFRAFDYLRGQGWFIGEMIWNFADFMTAQTTTRVGGNKKGIFTRERQPKSAAHYVRARYTLLAQELDGVKVPKGVFRYTSSPNRRINRTDL